MEQIALRQNESVKGLSSRVVRVEVEVGQTDGKNGEKIHNTILIDGLNVRFNIVKMRGVMQNKCTVAICNLKKEQVEYLTTINAWDIPQNQRKVLRVWAGYKDYNGVENVGLIFQGDIIRAFPTARPDVWLECNCLSGYLNQLKTGKLEIKGKVDMSVIFQKAAELMGLKLQYLTTVKKKVNGFFYAGSLTGIIKKLVALSSKIAVYQEDDSLIVEDYEPEKTDKDLEGKEVRTYNQFSGMIGIPEPDPTGVKIKVLLDPTLKCGEPIKLESELIPAANGVYWIYTIKHYGELRGTAFYSEILARNFQRAGAKL